MSMQCASVLSGPGIFLASVAIRCSFVEMLSGFGAPVILPSSGSMIWSPLPSAGSSGASSPVSSVLRETPTPDRPSRRASLPSLGGTTLCPMLRSREADGTPPRGLEVVDPVSGRDSWMEPIGSPRFLGNPDACMPCSEQTPVELPAPGQLRRRQCCLPERTHCRPPRLHLSGLSRTACTLAVYASQPRSPSGHARLASGWWPALTGRDWDPQDPFERFQL